MGRQRSPDTVQHCTYHQHSTVTDLGIDDMGNTLDAFKAFKSLEQDPPRWTFTTATRSDHHQPMMYQRYLIQLQNLQTKAQYSIERHQYATVIKCPSPSVQILCTRRFLCVKCLMSNVYRIKTLMGGRMYST